MGANDRKAMLELIDRCVAIPAAEIKLLKRWAIETTSVGRKADCLKRAQRIKEGPDTKVRAVKADAKGKKAAEVKRAPTDEHEAMVIMNEESLEERSAWKVDQLGRKAFSRALQRSQANATNSVRDAKAILGDCTRRS